MGFTPLGGVMMGTCTGDIDPAIIPYLMQYTDDFNTPEDISCVLNRESGQQAVLILGSGPNRIGQGIEFDYSWLFRSGVRLQDCHQNDGPAS